SSRASKLSMPQNRSSHPRMLLPPSIPRSPRAKRLSSPGQSSSRARSASTSCLDDAAKGRACPDEARSAKSGVISCGDSSRSAVFFKATTGFLLFCAACLQAAAAFAQAPAAPAPAAPAPAPAATAQGQTTGLPTGVTTYSSWKFERVGDHLHLINQAAIEGPNLKFFADEVDLYT